MPCKHTNCTLTVELLGRNVYTVLDLDPPVGRRASSAPVTIRISAYCHDCRFSSIYNGYASPTVAGASAWPVWLLERLAVLCKVDDSLRRACIACRVPGIQEA